MANLLLNPDRKSHQSFAISLIALCSEVLESPAHYDKYKVVNINHFKERSHVGHEFIILDVFDSDGTHDAFCLRAERRPSRRKADEQTRAERPVPWLDTLVTVSDDTISRVPESFSQRREALVVLRSFSAAVLLVLYHVYAAEARLEKDRILAGRLKVMPDSRAAADIKEEEIRQKDEETKRKDEAHEAMNKALTSAVVRRELERSTSFERTRQIVLPLLQTTEARREAEVQAWQSTFLSNCW
ncbi:hypothetical protein BU15DRAFT_65745 [Melanogaster broomeanus]|nr:hypothetical protein BU15DRAFT_65745 [Melanogaster broomeanus]